VQNILAVKVFENKLESINSVRDMALELIAKGSSNFKFKDTLLSPISCFNIFILEERKASTTYFVQQDSPKQYVYFTFYRTLMEIEQDSTSKIFQLHPRKMN
jgi:predicted LPLAT superfamily acyltransferase